jgi:hypothetical protein
VGSSDGSVETSTEIGSSNRDLLSRMSVLIEMEDTVETVESWSWSRRPVVFQAIVPLEKTEHAVKVMAQ